MTENITTQIRTWNSADVLLYEHFNRTLWEKIRDEGAQFYNDLRVFRQMKQQVFDECVISIDADVEQRLWKRNINSSNPICERLTVRTVDYVNNLRESISDHIGQNDLKHRVHKNTSENRRKVVNRQRKMGKVVKVNKQRKPVLMKERNRSYKKEKSQTQTISKQKNKQIIKQKTKQNKNRQ